MGFWKTLQAAFLPRLRAAADYEAAASTRRTTGWSPATSDINTLVFRNADTLRSRSRDMVRRNPWATNALDAFVGNSIGAGIKPQSIHADLDLREQIQALWLRWTDEADASGLTDFYGLQAIACRSVMEAGECFIRLRPRLPKDGLSVPLQLQPLEAEHLPTAESRRLPSGNYIRSTPADVGATYETFMRIQLRSIAAGRGDHLRAVDRGSHQRELLLDPRRPA